MSKSQVRFRQSEVARAIRAAKQAGAGQVRVLKDGTIVIDLKPSEEKQLDQAEETVEVIL